MNLDLFNGSRVKSEIYKKFYVYALMDPKDKGFFYVGKGSKKRLFEHEAKVKNNNPYVGNRHLTNTIKKMKAEGTPIFYSILFQSNDEQENYEKEKYFITQFKNLVNIHAGGRGRSTGKLEDTYGVEKALEIRKKVKENHARLSGPDNRNYKPIPKEISLEIINGIEYFVFKCSNPDNNPNCRVFIRRKNTIARSKSKAIQTYENKGRCCSCGSFGENNAMHKDKGRPNSMKGRSVYSVWLEKYGKEIADSMMNDFKKKTAEIQKGKKHSEESKAKMSKSNSKPKSEQGRLNIKLAAQARAKRQKEAKLT